MGCGFDAVLGAGVTRTGCRGLLGSVFCEEQSDLEVDVGARHNSIQSRLGLQTSPALMSCRSILAIVRSWSA